MIGQKLNKRYKITAVLGKGAMGTVYRAVDLHTRQEVALKFISSELAVNPVMLERFKHEGDALQKLKHPNIVGYINAFEWGGNYLSNSSLIDLINNIFAGTGPKSQHYVIVMEYVSGGSLYELLKQGPLSIERAQKICLDLSDALTRVHQLSIIHRDIKPENILIADDGTPKLADFGVARITEGTRMTRTGTQVGTPYYMAPEAWEGKLLDAQADIWSLGVILFEMLTGQVPFDGDTSPAVMTKVLTTEPPNLNDLRADVAPGLVKIIKRMLTRDKGKRYQTAREVAVDLERVQQAPSLSTKIIEYKEDEQVPEKVEKETVKKVSAKKVKNESAEQTNSDTGKRSQRVRVPVIASSIAVIICILGVIALALNASMVAKFFNLVSTPSTTTPAVTAPVFTNTVRPTFTATKLPPTPIFPVPVTLTIVNNSTTWLTIYTAGPVGRDLWPTGDWIQYGEKKAVEAGTSMDISTNFGDVWAVSNNTNAIAEYIVPLYYVTEASHQTITINLDGITIGGKLKRFGISSLQYTFPIAAVNFVNNSSVALDLHYVSSTGEDQNLHTIPAGSPQRIADVQFGDFFYLSDPSGNKVLVYVATENSEQTVSISDAAVAYHLGVSQ
jgi:serine/threonine protein kinase